jgi:ankyrin repeat protein
MYSGHGKTQAERRQFHLRGSPRVRYAHDIENCSWERNLADSQQGDFMMTKSAYIVRAIRGLLTIALVLVLMPAPDMAFAEGKNPSPFLLTPLPYPANPSSHLPNLLDYHHLVRFGPPDRMLYYHLGKIPVERKPPLFKPHPRYDKMRPGATPMVPPPPIPQPRNGLIKAAGRGDLGEMKLLLDKGADVNVKDGRGWTPLMEAANRGHSEIVRLLLEKGADVNLKHQYGWTALSIAKGKDNKEIERLLKARGAKK